MTFDELVEVTGASSADALRYVDPLNAAMALWAIHSKPARCCFLAHVAIETGNLSKAEEDLYYKTPERLMLIYPSMFKTVGQAAQYVRNPEGLSQLRYKGYHGRGGLQLTWEENYRDYQKATGKPVLEDPDLLLSPTEFALSAAWFFNAKGCIPPADKGDMVTTTRIINGKAMLKLAERTAVFQRAMRVLK